MGGIPKNIGYLHHLRYLRFSVYEVKLLPRSLSILYHLQFIIVDQVGAICFDNGFFPRDMNNLSNLRYLSGDWLNFQGIRKLKFLQEVKFRIKNENGYKIEELEHMNELRILSIKNLEEIRAAEEAGNAKLCDERKLTRLSLNWCYGRSSEDADQDLEERVLDNLQPHNYLKNLIIFNYMGTRSAIWMNKAHLINNLQLIVLCDCLEWEILPPLGQLPFLKNLGLHKLPKVKRLENKFQGNDICSVFPSLQRLEFIGMEALVDWFDASVVATNLFPCLTILRLENCPNSQELPNLPPKLESLELENVGWKTLNCCNISKSIPLQMLDVSDCPNIYIGNIYRYRITIPLCFKS